MAQVLIRNLDEGTVESYRQKAKLKGISLEQELRNVLDANRPLTPAERGALTRSFHAEFSDVQPSLTVDEIREGLE
ncbi:FitA-like ribbon-helix-helix domain-containing protein [Enterovirga aerilata]|uniref:Antitoxin FitA-like ribbon-helix-helix domain-containing protein n=1 Tax=Enterovirga aerilata TaxID=2730920 RepID=A0A849ICZ3_9HYPH|nr:hypothetical protein [Enterovirga sp. DB1703]NNM74105.1 hypothetical protein [Enterovirga sp. DB1703]